MPVPETFPHVESLLARALERLGRSLSDPQVDLTSHEGSWSAAAQDVRRAAVSRRRYELVAEIARGGMGTIFEVHDTDVRRPLAMKVLQETDLDVDDEDSKALADQLLQRFLEEAQVTGQLDHPCIVPLHEVGVDEHGRVYFTMRLVRGKHLGDVFRLARSGSEGWTLERAVEALIKVCEAMSYAHAKGVVHRDLKPQNIMAGRFGEVYVMDWGLAKVRGRRERDEEEATLYSRSFVRSSRAEDPSTVTIAGAVFGTPAYMAPEQARGAMEEVDARSDVYSLGAILYELLAGSPPYVPQGASVKAMHVLRWLLEGPPQALAKAAPEASRDLIAVCEKAMARDRSRRYPGMEALAEDLRRWLAGRTVSARPLAAGARAMRWCRRNPLVAGLLLAVTLGGAFGLWRLSVLNSDLVLQAARDDSWQKARMLEMVNAAYADEVAGRVDREHVLVTHDWADHAGAIPLPATFLTDVAERVTRESGSLEVRHYSDYPFAYRGEAKLDEFGRTALAALRADPEHPYEEIEEIDGRPMLRYAVARRMGQSCVDCHNTHAASTKKDWKVGDVRGVLEIRRPLDEDVRRSRSGLQGALTVVAGLVVVLTAACGFALLRGARGERRT